MSRTIVLDCAVSATWFIPDESSSHAQRILADIMDRKCTMIVPSLWWFEIMNVLRSAVLRKRIDEQAARTAVLLLKEIPKEVVEPETQGQFGILSLALADRLSAYDAAYLHLAHSCGAELFTLDTDLLSLKGKYKFIKHPSGY